MNRLKLLTRRRLSGEASFAELREESNLWADKAENTFSIAITLSAISCVGFVCLSIVQLMFAFEIIQ